MKLRWSKFWWLDFLADTRQLSLADTGAWIKILCLMAKNDPPGECSADPHHLARELGGHPRTWQNVVGRLSDSGSESCTGAVPVQHACSTGTAPKQHAYSTGAAPIQKTPVLVLHGYTLISRRMKRELEAMQADMERKRKRKASESARKAAALSAEDEMYSSRDKRDRARPADFRRHRPRQEPPLSETQERGDGGTGGDLTADLRRLWPTPPLPPLPATIADRDMDLLADRLEHHPGLLHELRGLVDPPARWMADRSCMSLRWLLQDDDRFARLLAGGYRESASTEDANEAALRRRDGELDARLREIREQAAPPEVAEQHLADLRARLAIRPPGGNGTPAPRRAPDPEPAMPEPEPGEEEQIERAREIVRAQIRLAKLNDPAKGTDAEE